ncbi:MAG: antitoxin Xre/MbcA/ParS toxin-binding domain-containing protein [Acidimicrobiales bacterium]
MATTKGTRTKSGIAKSPVRSATRSRVPGPRIKTTSRVARSAKAKDSWRPEQRARFIAEVAGGVRGAARLLDVQASQASRWASGKSIPGPDQAGMLVDVDHVLAHALLVWADPAVARDWLTTPNAHLDGVRPVDWIRTYGTTEVVDALRAEAAGAYA